MAKKARCRGKGAGSLVLRGRTWFARWTVNGKVFTRTTGKSDKREAEKKLAEFTAPFRLGNEVETLEAVAVKIDGTKAEIEEWKDSQPSMTLLQAWPAFTVKPKGKTARGRVIMPGERTLADYEGRWNAFCDWMDKTYPKEDKDGKKEPWELRQITKQHAERYIAEIGAGRSANTRNKTLTFLRLVFRVLSEDARLKGNPFEGEGLESAPLEVNRKRPLTLTELDTISKNLEGKGELELLFALGYYTGARLGDCVLMRWDNIDMGAKKIRYTPRKTAKKNEEITLIIAPTLLGLLDAVPKTARRGLVLPELGQLYQKDPAAVSKRVQQVFIDAGIETDLEVKGFGKKVARVGFHSLRHAHITALLEGGIPMDTVRKQAGHSTIGMTAHYYHASEKTLQATTDALPAINGAKGKNATGANVDAVLAMLEGLTDCELATVSQKVQTIISNRKSAQ